MASQHQLNANRANAQKCTGPKTPEGKARSSQNALKTGLDAKSEIIPCENRGEYDSLVSGYYLRFAPQPTKNAPSSIPSSPPSGSAAATAQPMPT